MNTSDPDYNSYIGVRHFEPNTIRLIRLALDIGTDMAPLKRKAAKRAKQNAGTPQGNYDESVLGAIRFMERNPDAGIIRIVDGDEHYTFAEMDIERQSSKASGEARALSSGQEAQSGV
jgi:hypothetical protein